MKRSGPHSDTLRSSKRSRLNGGAWNERKWKRRTGSFWSMPNTRRGKKRTGWPALDRKRQLKRTCTNWWVTLQYKAGIITLVTLVLMNADY